MARYELTGWIERICPHCNKIKELLCYEDKLDKTAHKSCKDCLKNKLRIKLIKDIKAGVN